MEEIKRMCIKEFRTLGFLQEVNRCFFHPLGLALEVTIDDSTGEEFLSSIWDYRDDPEGIIFGDNIIQQHRIDHVENLRFSKIDARKRLFGSAIQGVKNE